MHAVAPPEAVYDLKEGTLREALMDFFPKLRDMKANNPDYLDRCGCCFLHGLCEQCPGKSWMEHGTFDAPVEYLCRVAHAEAQNLGLLKEGERPGKWSNGRRVKAFNDKFVVMFSSFLVNP